jgi:hypothetical protein
MTDTIPIRDRPDAGAGATRAVDNQGDDAGTPDGGQATQALRMSKRLLQRAQQHELSDFLELCAAWQGMLHNTDDHREAVTAFVEKREGLYRGR